MKLKQITIILILLATTLFLLGCTEMSQKEKNLCYSLSTRSYTTIPTCESVEVCYNKLNSTFNTNLSYEQENKLYEMKNEIARSWFYYNLALKEQKKLSTQCKTGSAQQIPNTLNQMRFYLDNSFLELDNGIKNHLK